MVYWYSVHRESLKREKGRRTSHEGRSLFYCSLTAPACPSTQSQLWECLMGYSTDFGCSMQMFAHKIRWQLCWMALVQSHCLLTAWGVCNKSKYACFCTGHIHHQRVDVSSLAKQRSSVILASQDLTQKYLEKTPKCGLYYKRWYFRCIFYLLPRHLLFSTLWEIQLGSFLATESYDENLR